MAGDSSTSRVTEAEARFNGDLLWAAVDSVDKAAEIHIFLAGERNMDAEFGLWCRRKREKR